MEEQFGTFETEALKLTTEQIAHRFIEITLDFVTEHPAYFHVLDAPVRTTRKEANRSREIARIVRLKQPKVALGQAGDIVDVVVQVPKSLGPLYVDTQ